MQKLFSIVAATMLGGLSVAHAGLNFISAEAAGGGVVVTNASGQALDNGNIVRIGAFDTSGGNLAIIQNAEDFLTIDQFFTPLGEISDPFGTAARNGLTAAESGTVSGESQSANGPIVVNDSGGVDGNISAAVQDWTASYMAVNTRLYWWIFNSSNPFTATQMGIFSATGNPQWTSADPSNMFDFRTTAASTVNEILRGNFVDNGAGVDFLQLGFVPEPSRAMLILIGFGAAVMRRRR
ncbi:MAG: PEP-CTERM sorting domain-containing protein [Verrucomicrobiota bacterium]